MMRGTIHSRLLWCALIVLTVLTAGLLTGCPKQAVTQPAPVVTPPPLPPPPAATTPSKPATKAPSETGTPQTAADPKHMTQLEKLHVPQFALPTAIKPNKPLSVTVNVGQVPHPMTSDHYIQWVELYLDGKLVKKVALKPGDQPMAKFQVTPTAGDHKLKAQIFCNIHGLWANTVDLKAK